MRFHPIHTAPPMKPVRQHCRAGVTLFEMLVVISISTVVMGSIGVMVYGVWSAQRSLGNQQVAMDNIARLADQFRSDIHAAASVDLVTHVEAPNANDPKPEKKVPVVQKLIVVLPDQRHVEYQVDSSGVSRVVLTGDEITQRETYVLPENFHGDWKLASSNGEADSNSKQASFLLSYPLGTKLPEFSDQRQLSIDALVGLHRPEVRIERRGS